MAKKNAAATPKSNGATLAADNTPSQDSDAAPAVQAVPPLDVTVHEPVKVNNANLTELKIALDDAVKRALSRPGRFTQNHMHTDVRLVLGWTSVLVALATGLYSWKISFEESKLGTAVGVSLYMVLSAIQLAYAYFVEGETVFVGRRKTLDKRIETERLVVTAKTTNPEPGSPPLTEKLFSASLPASYVATTVYPRKVSKYLPPHYKIAMDYTHTAAGGKSLIKKGKIEDERCYADFFDDQGTLDEPRFAAWVFALVQAVESQ